MKYPKLIGFLGLKNSGKDTAGKYLQKHHGYRTAAFADPIKTIVAETFSLPYIRLLGSNESDRKWRERPQKNLGGKCPRDLLKLVGQTFRQIDNELWIKKTLKPITSVQAYNLQARYCITDVRFLEEIEAIQKAGGIVVYIDNPNCSFEDEAPSEQAHHYYKQANYILENFETLDVFYSNIEDFINAFHPN